MLRMGGKYPLWPYSYRGIYGKQLQNSPYFPDNLGFAPGGFQPNGLFCRNPSYLTGVILSNRRIWPKFVRFADHLRRYHEGNLNASYEDEISPYGDIPVAWNSGHRLEIGRFYRISRIIRAAAGKNFV